MSKRKAITYSTEKVPERCLIIHPVLNKSSARSTQQKIEEIEGLAKAIDLDVVHIDDFNLDKIQAGHFLGKGQRERIKGLVDDLEPDIVIFNYALSPVQQRNLERTWKAKVIDRTGLILEIFGARAQTKEGVLQVDLAALEYQRSRLVRSWTHLERQRGGAGFMGGPGETQIEIDRRLISERIVKLKSELEKVRKTRDLGRKARERVPYPAVALVGYTNAGKSTLFNTLTGEKIFAKDLLFATLDPTLRKIELPNGQAVILSDTVGFISDLPTDLIAAFRATLEQTLHADVILHVIDVSRSDYEAQRNDVINILEDMGIEYENDPRVLEVYNKIDALDEDELADIERKARFERSMVLVSAAKGQGTDKLLEAIARITAEQHVKVTYKINAADGKALAWLYEHADVVSRDDQGKFIFCSVRIDPANMNKFQSQYQYTSEEHASGKS
ncbi:MAG: GTPase HflX [Alphaproteobacteria bacterium]|nr:GTPase HflX [Alphaproteobacteria bacterium]